LELRQDRLDMLEELNTFISQFDSLPGACEERDFVIFL
jgi:hypothetical protein